MTYTKLEKSLMVLSYLGISITLADGHRWICIDETATDINGSLITKKLIEMEDNGTLSTKVYGGIKEAIFILDMCIKNETGRGLQDLFDEIFHPRFDIESFRRKEVERDYKNE